MDFSDSNSNWIWAAKEGEPLNTDSPDARIREHDAKGRFQLDLTKATGGDAVNPFLGAAKVPSGGTTPGAVTASPVEGSGGESEESGGSAMKRHRMIIAHGVLMSLAFVIFYPLGAILIRALSFKGLVWVHAGVQVFAYTLALAGMGIGVWFTQNSDASVSSVDSSPTPSAPSSPLLFKTLA